MNGLKAQFDDSEKEAEQQQANAVGPQWATFVARMSLGTETVSSAQGGDRQTAISTESLRPTKLDGAPKPVNGVLDIYVEASGKVSGATMHGVSQELADRLHNLELANVKMPVRFVIRPRDAVPTIVTRDEAGRVRVEGDYGGTDHEPDAVKKATTMVDTILANRLSAFGVEIKADDATGRG
jgi:hypothetical protein